CSDRGYDQDGETSDQRGSHLRPPGCGLPATEEARPAERICCQEKAADPTDTRSATLPPQTSIGRDADRTTFKHCCQGATSSRTKVQAGRMEATVDPSECPT